MHIISLLIPPSSRCRLILQISNQTLNLYLTVLATVNKQSMPSYKIINCKREEKQEEIRIPY